MGKALSFLDECLVCSGAKLVGVKGYYGAFRDCLSLSLVLNERPFSSMGPKKFGAWFIFWVFSGAFSVFRTSRLGSGTQVVLGFAQKILKNPSFCSCLPSPPGRKPRTPASDSRSNLSPEGPKTKHIAASISVHRAKRDALR